MSSYGGAGASYMDERRGYRGGALGFLFDLKGGFIPDKAQGK